MKTIDFKGFITKQPFILQLNHCWKTHSMIPNAPVDSNIMVTFLITIITSSFESRTLASVTFFRDQKGRMVYSETALRFRKYDFFFEDRKSPKFRSNPEFRTTLSHLILPGHRLKEQLQLWCSG